MSIATDTPTTCGARSCDEEAKQYADAPFPFIGCATMIVAVIIVSILAWAWAWVHGCME